MNNPELPVFDRINVLCIGDIMLDRFVSGNVSRISPESPVPIVLVEGSNSVPGGSANVGRNIASLGGHCTLVGLIGNDDGGRDVLSLLSEDTAITPELITSERPTTEKTRYVAAGQHVLRVDRETTADLDSNVEADLIQKIEQLIDGHQVVVLSDYAKGALTEKVVRCAIDAARKRNIPVVVDPKKTDLSGYSGATVVTPNRKETREATGVDPADNFHADLAGRKALSMSGLQSVLLTLAERGMTLVSVGNETVYIPATAREVFDVVGAGDTVVATLALCLGAGLSLNDSAFFANAAAGIVVGKHGTATVTRSELLLALEPAEKVKVRLSQSKLSDWKESKRLVESWHLSGLKVGFTNGCFDLVHAGHIELLDFCKENCDRLIVAIDTDASVSRLKGSGRPINSQEDRARLIGAIGSVDAVVFFETDELPNLIRYLAPNVLIKGGDYTTNRIVGAKELLASGGAVLTCPLVQGKSSTKIVDKIRTDG